MPTYIKDGFVCGDNPNYHRQIRESTWKSSDRADNILIYLGIAGGRGFASWPTGIKSIVNKFVTPIITGIVGFIAGTLVPVIGGVVTGLISGNIVKKEVGTVFNDQVSKLGVNEFKKVFDLPVAISLPERQEIINKFTSEIPGDIIHHFDASIFLKRLGEYIWQNYTEFAKFDFSGDEAKKAFLAGITIQIIFADNNVNSRNSELANAPYGRDFFLVPGFSHFMNSISKFSTYKGINNAIEQWAKIGAICGSFKLTTDEQLVNETYQNYSNSAMGITQKESKPGIAIAIAALPFLLKKGF